MALGRGCKDKSNSRAGLACAIFEPKNEARYRQARLLSTRPQNLWLQFKAGHSLTLPIGPGLP